MVSFISKLSQTIWLTSLSWSFFLLFIVESQSLYTINDQVQADLSKFRFSSARSSKLQALVLSISKSQEITIEATDDFPKGVIDDVDDLKDTLPVNAPRFIILSYPHTRPDGRLASPFVMLYYRPPTANQTLFMSYAGAVELVRNKTGVAKVIEFQDEDDLDDLKSLIGDN